MVCGRYPKEVRHYERNLKRKCFAKLKNNVWENKTKWQLILKADCHNRWRLLSFCFYSWVVFVKYVKKKKLNVRKAEEHYEFKLKGKALKAFNEEIEKNCELIRKCRKKSEFNLKKRIYENWRQYVNFRMKNKFIKNFADNVRGEILIVNYLYVWSQRLGEKNELERKFEKSSFIYELFLMRKGFNKLRLHANRRRHKKEIVNFVTTRYEKILKKKIFTRWKNLSSQKKLHRDFTERIHIFHENYLIKRYLDVWISRHENLTEGKLAKKNSEAENLYRRKLLINFFGRLKKFAEKKRMENFLTSKFFEFYNNEIVKSYLGKCRDVLREKTYYSSLELKAINFREEKLIGIYFGAVRFRFHEIKSEEVKLSKAGEYYENNLLYNFFNSWMKFLRMKREKIKKMNQINFYYETRLKGKILDRLEKFLILKRRKKIGMDFYYFSLKLKTLKKWKLYHERKKIKTMKLTIARRKYSGKIKKKCLNALKTELISAKEKTGRAFSLYQKNLLKINFSKWRDFTNWKINFNFKMNSMKLTINNSRIEQYLSIWYERYERKLFFDRKIEQLEGERHERILKICFTKWRRFFLKKKEIKENEMTMNDLKPLIAVESYFFKLCDLYESRKKDKAKLISAVALEEKLIKRKYFKRWLSFKKWKEEIAVNCENRWSYVHVDGEKNSEYSPISNFRSERKQPMIPNYLMNRMEVDSEKKKPRKRNDETYTVFSPVNKKLPNVDWGNEEIDLSERDSFL